MAQQYAGEQPAGSNHRINNVALVGASGTVGKHMLDELIKRGRQKVTILTRSSLSGIPSLVNVAIVDYDDEATLVEPLKGQYFLIITMSNRAPHETQTKLIAAAAKAGVEWIMPNEYGPPFVDYPPLGQAVAIGGHTFYDSLLAVRKQIEELGMNYVVLGCGFRYEHSLASIPNSFGFDFANRKVTLIGEGDTKINVSTLEQCGRAVASLLALKVVPGDASDASPTLSSFRNKTMYISSFLINQNDMLASVIRVAGDREDDWEVVEQDLVERYKQGVDEFKAGNYGGFIKLMYTRGFSKDGAGDYETKGWLSNDVLGLPREDLDMCTKKAVKMFEQGEKYNNTA